MELARAMGADVINMSLTLSSPNESMDESLQECATLGVAVVCAAGNYGNRHAKYPGISPFATGVASVGNGGTLSLFSGAGQAIELAAPGELILSAYPRAELWYGTGTSMATPIVAGCVALTMEALDQEPLAAVQSLCGATTPIQPVVGVHYGRVSPASTFWWNRPDCERIALPHRIKQLIENALRAGWRQPSDDLVKRTAKASSVPLGSESPPQELDLSPEANPGVRSEHATLTQSGRELFGSFDGGEIACLVEEGSLLGSWVVRGTVWLSDPASGPMSLEWIDDDHVLSSIALRTGEPFRVEEVSGGAWHLELRLGDGRTYALRPAISRGGDGDAPRSTWAAPCRPAHPLSSRDSRLPPRIRS
jgi:hypothetical protein